MIKSFLHKGIQAFFEKGSKSGTQSDHAEELRLQLTSLNQAQRPADVGRNVDGFAIVLWLMEGWDGETSQVKKIFKANHAWWSICESFVTYSVKEIFYTLQGEGHHTGRPAVFCRFAGCNLWSGREADRANAICQFCDTDFVGTNGELGGKFKQAKQLAQTINQLWPATYPASKYVVFTGGEPLMQLDAQLISAMHEVGFEIAIETNGTIPVPKDIDWVCVSPKIGSTLVVIQGDELKVVIPQIGQQLQQYEQLDFTHFYVQAMDGPLQAENCRRAVEFCKANPRWKLSLQTHKLLQIP